MRLRGLPRDMNCGNVELVPVRSCRYKNNFKTCSSCEFTDVKYFRLECEHIHCESCLVFIETQSDDLRVQCTVCNEVRSAREEFTAAPTLLLARLECPCGVEGNLHFLSRHRRECKQLRRLQSSDLDSSQASASSTSSVASSSSSISAKNSNRFEDEIPKSVEFVLKGYLAQELMRMKEDIINTTRLEREESEANMRRMMDRQDHLDSRIHFLDSLDNRVEMLESSADRTRLEPSIVARLDSIDSQVHGLRCGDYLREIAAQQFTRLHSRSVFLWFDVKSLLRDFNRTRTASATADQFVLIAGYPCKLHLQIDQDDGQKSLVLYLGSCEKLPYSANWPMRRQLTFRIFDTQGSAVFENTFSTTDASCREYFKGPGSPSFGTYFGVDLCSTEELTVENFYQRNNGMICLGISVNPRGDTPAD